MRSISSYDLPSIASNASVMFVWHARRLLHWPRVVLFFPVYLVLLLFFALFVALDDFAWKALLPSRYRRLRRRYSMVSPERVHKR